MYFDMPANSHWSILEDLVLFEGSCVAALQRSEDAIKDRKKILKKIGDR